MENSNAFADASEGFRAVLVKERRNLFSAETEVTISVRAARQRYAEGLRFAANIRSRAVIGAFATVPRERFVGAGPWRIKSLMRLDEYWTTEDADPRHVYHDVLIA